MWSSSPNFNPELQDQISNYLAQSLCGCLTGTSNLTWPKTIDLATYSQTYSSYSCPSSLHGNPVIPAIQESFFFSFPQISHKIHQLFLSVLPSKCICSSLLSLQVLWPNPPSFLTSTTDITSFSLLSPLLPNVYSQQDIVIFFKHKYDHVTPLLTPFSPWPNGFLVHLEKEF